MAEKTPITTELDKRTDDLETQQPIAFSAYLNANAAVSPSSIVPWDMIEYNYGGHFTTTGSKFVVPEDGLYHFTLIVTSPGTQTISFTSVSVDGGRTRDMFEAIDFIVNREYHASVTMELTAGQEVTILSGGSFTFEGGNTSFYSKFQGHKVR